MTAKINLNKNTIFILPDLLRQLKVDVREQ